jgi:mRNA-degrading endonuclease RelE of RelBE toxin-antitoxin system
MWKENPGHPSLQFKLVGLRNPVFSIRVGVGYRALGLKVDVSDKHHLVSIYRIKHRREAYRRGRH